jgi:putative transposase
MLLNQARKLYFCLDQFWGNLTLTIVDNFSRECPTIFVDQGITGEQVVDLLNRLKFTRGLPKTIQVDNGPEFISKALDKWAYEHGIILDFSRPGKPQDNALVESFNGSFRDECLNVNWFLSLEDARKKIELETSQFFG